MSLHSENRASIVTGTVAPDEAMIVNKVTKYFNSPHGKPNLVLDSFSMTVPVGQFVCVVGPSGCGKTTLLNIIAGFEKATVGEVIVDQSKVTRPGPDRGVVFQDYAIFPWLTVRQNIAFGLKVSGRRGEANDIDRTVDHYLDVMTLRGFEKYYPGQISGGMRQRVAIARVLANQPKMLLMDEPFAALDAQTRFVLQKELVRVWAAEKITVFFITHNIEEAVLLGDRVIVMGRRPGRIISDTVIDLPRPRDVSANDFNSYRAQFLETLEDQLSEV